MITSNVYFGVTTQRFLRALRAAITANQNLHPILQDVYVGFKKLPVDAPQKERQVILQANGSEDVDNKFIGYRSFGVSFYAKSLADVELLAATIEGLCSTIKGPEGIRSVDVLVSASEVENSFSTQSSNQSTIEDWRLCTVEVSFTPLTFVTEI